MSLQSMSMNTSLKNAKIFVGVEEDSTELDAATSAPSSTTFNSKNSNRHQIGKNESSGKLVQRASSRYSRTTSVPYQRSLCSNKRNNLGLEKKQEEEMRKGSNSSRLPTDTGDDAVVSSTSSNQWRTGPTDSVDSGTQLDAECCSSSEGSSSRKSSCSRYSGPADNRPKREKDPEILNRRQKQIDYGKNTIGYDNYIRTVPRHERKFDDPRTPDKTRVYSRRAFDGLIKEWRLKLHKYDNA